jgi:hypothetical protein
MPRQANSHKFPVATLEVINVEFTYTVKERSVCLNVDFYLPQTKQHSQSFQSFGCGQKVRGYVVRVPDLSLLQRVETDSGAHPASRSTGTYKYFFRGTATVVWSWSFTSWKFPRLKISGTAALVPHTPTWLLGTNFVSLILLNHFPHLLLTYLLTPWSRVLLEKLTSLQRTKKLPAFYGTRRFITALTCARHLSLSWASSIHSIPLFPLVKHIKSQIMITIASH